MHASRSRPRPKAAFLAVPLALAALLSGCETTASRPVAVTPGCTTPAGNDLARAMDHTRQDLAAGCAHRFDDYQEALLAIAEENPDPNNPRRFSELFEWAVDQGLLSRRQAQGRYNRYFNVKFVSLMGDFNNCTSTCPRQREVLDAMAAELADKERGLLRISQDQAGYYRADRLLQETELVLAATCSACAAR
jgi:hypothetical protein